MRLRRYLRTTKRVPKLVAVLAIPVISFMVRAARYSWTRGWWVWSVHPLCGECGDRFGGLVAGRIGIAEGGGQAVDGAVC
jgi:hypothetical protein